MRQIAPLVSTVFPDFISSRTSPARREGKVGVSAKDRTCYTHIETKGRSWCEKNKWNNWNKTRRSTLLFISYCVPLCSLIASIMMVTGVYTVETISLHIKRNLSIIGSDTWERKQHKSQLTNSLGRAKTLPLKFSPKWLLFFFCLSLLKLLKEKWQLPHPHPEPHMQSGFWQEIKVFSSYLDKAALC